MQFNINTKGSNTHSFGTNGGILTTELYLVGNPTQALEASTKQYVDSKTSTIAASTITSGTISGDRLPGYLGDVTAPVGSTSLTLKTSGVAAGTYTKVTVTNKGIATQGSSLTTDDIPNLNWSKIVTGKPTTLAGYGITDGFPKTGGTPTGHISVMNQPSLTMHAANKSYVDTQLSSSAPMGAGSEIAYASVTTPSGFLRANGAEVLKVDYAALYSAIGDQYSVTEDNTGGVPWRQQYQFNTANNPDIWTWGTDTALPTPVVDGNLVVTKNRVYLLGGANATVATSLIYTAPINTDGTLGAWVTAGNLPDTTAYLQPVVTKNRIYLLSGYYTTVYTAVINTDGTIGTWSTSHALPGQLSWSHIVKTRTRLYVISGRDQAANPSPTAYFTDINADGTINPWYTVGSFLPQGRVGGEVIVTKNRVYIVGGWTNPGGTTGTSVTAPIAPDGTLGAWTAGPALPIALSYSTSVVTRKKAYILGGYGPNNSRVGTSYVADVNTDGTLGDWRECQSLPEGRESAHAFFTGSKLYFVGGYGPSGAVATVYRASFSGGLNDYSPYYDGSFVFTDTTKFNLPDRTANETADLKYYIKY